MHAQYATSILALISGALVFLLVPTGEQTFSFLSFFFLNHPPADGENKQILFLLLFVCLFFVFFWGGVASFNSRMLY